MQAAALLLIYGLALLGGVAVAWRARMETWLAWVLIAFTAGAAQLLAAMQLLSLAGHLQVEPLEILVGALTLVLWLVVKPWGTPRLPALPAPARGSLPGFLRRNPLLCLLSALALAAIPGLAWLQQPMMPLGDAYHFAMPLRWAQAGTMLPFAASNPREIALSFGSEALCFPGVIIAGSWLPFGLLAALAKVLLSCVVTALARRLGAAWGPALGAGALVIGYPPFGLTTPDQVLASLWVAAALFFLFEGERAGAEGTRCAGFSVFFFLMACGVKNLVTLLAPAYGLAALWAWRRQLLAWPLWGKVSAAAVLGLLCSTTLWLYLDNYRWFGDPRGPALLQEHLATDFSAPAIRTRELRGFLSSFTDPIWLPAALRERYGAGLQGAVRLLGGRPHLIDDTEFYDLTGEALRPGTGLGPLAFCVFAPALFLALFRPPAGRRAEHLLLALFTLLALALVFAALRTQRDGLSRLLGPALVAGLPLAAGLLRGRWMRAGAGAVFLWVLATYSVYGLGARARRAGDPHPSWLTAHILKLQHNHTKLVTYTWTDAPPGELAMREDWSQRELYALFLSRVPERAGIAFLGKFNAEEVYLYGPAFSHRVWCLADARTPDRREPIPPAAEYLVAEEGSFTGLPDLDESFAPWLEVRAGEQVIFAARRRVPAPAAPALVPEKGAFVPSVSPE